MLGLKAHPAGFPSKLPEFFIRFLTDPGDLVVDIFAGSNTTRFVAERELRYWLAFESELDYIYQSDLICENNNPKTLFQTGSASHDSFRIAIATSSFRFATENLDELKLSLSHQKIMLGESLEISLERRQLNLV